MSLLRRTFLAAAVTLALAAEGVGQAADRIGAAEVTLGDANAKVKMIEYASVTCPHCAQFHNEVFPAFKAKYIDTGLVQFTFREFPTQPANVAVAGFMLARCAGPERYFAVLDSLFRGQAQMYDVQDASKFLADAGVAGGMDQEGIRACLQDEPAVAAMGERYQRAMEVEKVEGTPTFIIGETRLVGSQTLAQLDEVIQPLLAR